MASQYRKPSVSARVRSCECLTEGMNTGTWRQRRCRLFHQYTLILLSNHTKTNKSEIYKPNLILKRRQETHVMFRKQSHLSKQLIRLRFSLKKNNVETSISEFKTLRSQKGLAWNDRTANWAPREEIHLQQHVDHTAEDFWGKIMIIGRHLLISKLIRRRLYLLPRRHQTAINQHRSLDEHTPPTSHEIEPAPWFGTAEYFQKEQTITTNRSPARYGPGGSSRRALLPGGRWRGGQRRRTIAPCTARPRDLQKRRFLKSVLDPSILLQPRQSKPPPLPTSPVPRDQEINSPVSSLRSPLIIIEPSGDTILPSTEHKTRSPTETATKP